MLAANTAYWVKVGASTGVDVVWRSTDSDSAERVDSGWSFSGVAKTRTGELLLGECHDRFNERFMMMSVDIAAEGAERLESVDLPASTATAMSIREGQAAYGELGSGSDIDWIKVEGLQNNRRYRLEVEFLGTGSIGGSFGLNSAYPGGAANGIGNLWGSNWSGSAVLDFSVRDAHVKSYWLEVVPANGMNVFLRDADGSRIIRNGRGVLDPATVHVGNYVVTLRALDGVKEMVSNFGQGYDDRYEHEVVGHQYSRGRDDGRGDDWLGLFNDYAIDFRTGTHFEGYVLDRIEAQVQMGRTRVGSNDDVIIQASLTNRPVVSTEQLLVTEGDTNGSTYTVELSVSPRAGRTIRVNISGQSGNSAVDLSTTDISVDPSTLEFTADDWNTPQTVTVTADQDADSVNDDFILVHKPVGRDFYGVTRLAVRVDDDEDSAAAELPDAPVQTYQTSPRLRPLGAARRADATPLIAIYRPYAQSEAFDARLVASKRMLLCTPENNAAYESGLVHTGERFTDVIYAGDCADVKLAPNARYWIVFQNYYEVPITSVLSADGFYYVAKARDGDEDPGRRPRVEHRRRSPVETLHHRARTTWRLGVSAGPAGPSCSPSTPQRWRCPTASTATGRCPPPEGPPPGPRPPRSHWGQHSTSSPSRARPVLWRPRSASHRAPTRTGPAHAATLQLQRAGGGSLFGTGERTEADPFVAMPHRRSCRRAAGEVQFHGRGRGCGLLRTECGCVHAHGHAARQQRHGDGHQSPQRVAQRRRTGRPRGAADLHRPGRLRAGGRGSGASVGRRGRLDAGPDIQQDAGRERHAVDCGVPCDSQRRGAHRLHRGSERLLGAVDLVLGGGGSRHGDGGLCQTHRRERDQGHRRQRGGVLQRPGGDQQHRRPTQRPPGGRRDR